LFGTGVRRGGGRSRNAPDLKLAGLSAPAVLALLVLAVAAAAYGLWSAPSSPSRSTAPAPSFTDVQLHRDEVAFAHNPATYYARVMDEQRRQHYPMRPFVAVRPPVLAFFLSWLPGGALGGRMLVGALAAAVAGLWTVRLVGPIGAPGAAVAGLALATGVVAAFTPNGYLMHECWAGLLIALSLGLYPGDQSRGRSLRLLASLAAGLAAALVRELALAFLGVMALMALLERRPREALWWCAAIGACLLALLAHALAVLRHTLPTDPGMGWVRLGGWSFVLAADRWNAVVALKPWLPAVLVPAALAGSLAWGGTVGPRLALTLIGYAAGFLVVGRPEDVYWGLMIAPLLPLGWAGLVAAGLGLMTPLGETVPARPAPRRRRGRPLSAARGGLRR
jgi:hypothetical protein